MPREKKEILPEEKDLPQFIYADNRDVKGLTVAIPLPLFVRILSYCLAAADDDAAVKTEALIDALTEIIS
jgi:hypothetical protein